MKKKNRNKHTERAFFLPLVTEANGHSTKLKGDISKIDERIVSPLAKKPC